MCTDDPINTRCSSHSSIVEQPSTIPQAIRFIPHLGTRIYRITKSKVLRIEGETSLSESSENTTKYVVERSLGLSDSG